MCRTTGVRIFALTACAVACSAEGPADSSSAGSGGTGGAAGSSTAGAASGGASGHGGSASGGTQSATGGAPGTGGGAQSGGSGGGTGGTGVAGSNGAGTSGSGGSGTGSGGAPTCVPGCGTHKWACWPMPNPAGSGLPNPASYTDMGDVVHDDVTCLDWHKTASPDTYDNAGAIAYCENSTVGGYDDWRVPTRVELASIVDWTRSTLLDPVFTAQGGFHKTGSNWVLTIEQRGAGAGRDVAWAYNMSDGIVSNNRSAADQDRVRCVRGGGTGEGFDDHAVAPPDQYTELSVDEVRDNYTGLIWQRDGEASGPLSWEAAVQYCETLELGGSADWRLPSVRELATLVDEATVAPSINRTMFPNTRYGARSNNWYWASHRRRDSTTASWGINFDDGFTGFNAGAEGAWNHWTEAYAKCVR